jgi:hypothetical protein
MYILLDYAAWWYSKGIVLLFKYLKAFLIIVTDTFSVKIIISTFFKPWKKDATPTGGLSLDQKLKVMIFNLISVGFGMVVKSFFFIGYIVSIIFVIVFDLIAIIFWLLTPLLIIEMIVFGILYLIR